MNRLVLSLFLVVVCALAASSATCLIDGSNKDKGGVQVIRLDDPGDGESSENGIIEIHIPSGNRRKRETNTKETEKVAEKGTEKKPKKPCKKIKDCSLGQKCDLKTSKCASIFG